MADFNSLRGYFSVEDEGAQDLTEKEFLKLNREDAENLIKHVKNARHRSCIQEIYDTAHPLQPPVEGQSTQQPVLMSSSMALSEYVQVEEAPLVQNLSNYIDKAIKTYEDPVKFFHSPYITICQSSGYGKTRLAMELKEFYYVLYVCLRHKDVPSGFPDRSSIADLFDGTEIKNRKNHYLRVLIAMVQAVSLLTIKHNKDIVESIAFFDNSILQSDVFYSTVTEQLGLVAALPSVSTLQNLLKDFYKTRGKRIIFVFDEAKALLQADSTVPSRLPPDHPQRGLTPVPLQSNDTSELEEERNTYFRILRRLIRDCTPSCFFIFMDTSSKISNFSPAAIWDSSLRSVEPSKVDLFPPFTELATIGILSVKDQPFCDHRDKIHLEIDDETKVLDMNRFDLIGLNRPLYPEELRNSWRKTQIFDAKSLWEGVRDFARFKLIPKPYELWTSLEQLIPMAIKFAVIPLSSSYNEKLVAHHMATLQTLSYDRRVISAAYMLEPIHGEAASLLLFQHFEKLLENMYSLRVSGNLGILQTTGDIGEFLASVILSRAFDITVAEVEDKTSEGKVPGSPTRERYRTPTFFGRPITVKEFFKTLVRQTLDETFQQSLDRFSLHMISFLQFVQIHRPVDSTLLKEAYRRRAALLCKRGQTGIDIVIPIALSNVSVVETLSGDSPLSDYNFSAIFIQVKNYHSSFTSSKIDEWFQMVDEVAEKTVPGFHYFSIIMVVGSFWHQSYEVTQREGCTRVLLQQIEQSTYPFLSVRECILMKLIASPSIQPEHYYHKISCYYNQDPQKLEDRLNPIGAAKVPETLKVFTSPTILPFNTLIQRGIKGETQRVRKAANRAKVKLAQQTDEQTLAEGVEEISFVDQTLEKKPTKKAIAVKLEELGIKISDNKLKRTTVSALETMLEVAEKDKSVDVSESAK